MTKIGHENNLFGVYNEAGYQVEASFAAGKTGLNPKELLEASLALCMTITIEKMLERDQVDVDLDELEIEVQMTKAENGPSRFKQADVVFTMPTNLSKEYKQKLIKSAERACTIGNTLEKGLKIRIVD